MSTTLPASYIPAPPTPGPGAPIPDSLGARLVAEWASGVREQTLWFTYDGNLNLVLDRAMLGPVYTWRDAGRPRVSRVFLSLDAGEVRRIEGEETQMGQDARQVGQDAAQILVDELEGDGSSPQVDADLAQIGGDLAQIGADAVEAALGTLALELGGLEISGDTADAVFWSESAVEKFLFPYYASMFAWQAADFLRKVTRAWYEYDGTRVQVVALVHRCGPGAQPGRLSMAGTLYVVYARVEDGGFGHLQMNALDHFLADEGFFRSAEQGPAQPVTTPGGLLGSVPLTPGTGNLSSIPARELAEFASGIRGQHLYLTASGNQLEVWACDGPGNCAPPGDPALFTPLRRPDRPAPAFVAMEVEDRRVTLVGPGSVLPGTPPDAVFWTDGAVEKLMVPYYASVNGRYTPFTAPLLQGTWDGTLPVGDSHDLSKAVPALQSLSDDPEDRRDTEVFGLVHLPRSEWVPESDGTTLSLERRTAVLRLDAHGVFHADPLSRR